MLNHLLNSCPSCQAGVSVLFQHPSPNFTFVEKDRQVFQHLSLKDFRLKSKWHRFLTLQNSIEYIFPYFRGAMIDSETAWEIVKQNALKGLKAKIEWQSIVHNKRYSISKVLHDKIIINRLSGGQAEELTAPQVKKAIEDFNARDCKVQRGQLILPTVAEETALVLFHPRLAWDRNKEHIIEIALSAQQSVF